MTNYPLGFNTRRQYVDRVLNEHLQRDRDEILFLDPDNGMGESLQNGEQFHENHLQVLWNGMRRGSVLFAIQFQWNIPDWVDALTARIADVIGVNMGDLITDPWGNSFMWHVVKP